MLASGGAMRTGAPPLARRCRVASAPLASAPRSTPTLPPTPPPFAFSFSAGGLLFPYHWGVAAELSDRGVLDRTATPIGGASAGSIIVACLRSGLPVERVTDACLSLAADCRTKGTRSRLGPVLEAMLRELLPADVHERCSAGGNAHIAVTRLFPSQAQAVATAEAVGAAASPSSSTPPPPLDRFVRSELLSSFDSRDDLIGAVLTSSHIPWYLDGRATRPYRGGECLDGGLTQFIPAIPGAVAASSASASSSSGSSGSDSDGDGGEAVAQTRLVRVTCFPSRAVDAAVQRAARLLAPEGGGVGGGGVGAAAAATREAEAALSLERAAAAGGGADFAGPRFADLSPDRFDSDWGVSMRETIAMAFEPAPEPTLLALMEKGREDARRWMAANDVGAAAAAAASARMAA